MFLSTSKEIWETIQQKYYKKNNSAQISEIKIKLISANQGNYSITKYTNLMKNLW